VIEPLRTFSPWPNGEPAHRGPEDELLPYAADRDHLVIAYSPLAQGLLSGVGNLRDGRAASATSAIANKLRVPSGQP
jgi:aryl-alcohol dehydrogenase-like predicted oxidoreductase